jgi:hypothetical protein
MCLPLKNACPRIMGQTLGNQTANNLFESYRIVRWFVAVIVSGAQTRKQDNSLLKLHRIVFKTEKLGRDEKKKEDRRDETR